MIRYFLITKNKLKHSSNQSLKNSSYGFYKLMSDFGKQNHFCISVYISNEQVLKILNKTNMTENESSTQLITVLRLIFGKNYSTYQLIYVALVYEERIEEKEFFFSILGVSILFLIIISLLFLFKTILVKDIVTFSLAFFGYPAAVFLTKFKYNNKNGPNDTHENKSSLGLEVNEMKRNSQDLTDETLDEQIETTTKMLVERAFNIKSGLIFFMNFKENSSNVVVKPQNVITNKSLHEPVEQLGYFTFLSILSLLSQYAAVFSLGWIEIVKYRIRRVPPRSQPPPEPQRQRIQRRPLPPPYRRQPPPPYRRRLPPPSHRRQPLSARRQTSQFRQLPPPQNLLSQSQRQLPQPQRQLPAPLHRRLLSPQRRLLPPQRRSHLPQFNRDN
ncbi:hypothetical protein Avbf_13457 [Armadillidium vulgare]|nr:hypothetical protein Avbf_13457 [Armadillidium vulgare]